MIDQETEIIFNRSLASNTFLMGLWSPPMAKLAKPGQFVMIRISQGMDPLLRRPFSICGIQDETSLLILYRIRGKGTAMMSETPRGRRLSVLGPLGRGFDTQEMGSDCLLVSGGIGIAPLVFLASSTAPNHGRFLCGYSSSNEIVPVDLFGLEHEEVQIATDDGTAGHQGPVTELLERHLADVSTRVRRVYTCGPLPMLKRIVHLTGEKGTPCQASLEAHMACGVGVCQGCAVRAAPSSNIAYYHVCRDGPVFWSNALNWKRL